MKEIEFDIELTAGDLYAFSMRHTYGSISGIFGVVISLSCWIILAVRFGAMDTTARIALFIIGCLFTIVQPVMLYSKSKEGDQRKASLYIVTRGDYGVPGRTGGIRKMV